MFQESGHVKRSLLPKMQDDMLFVLPVWNDAISMNAAGGDAFLFMNNMKSFAFGNDRIGFRWTVHESDAFSVHFRLPTYARSI